MRARVLVAVTIVTAGLVTSPPSAAGRAAVTPATGYGDRNGAGADVRMGNGIRNVSQLTVGSARNGTGIQQRTVGVSGVANAQSTICGRRSRFCDVTQRIRASDRQSEMITPPGARIRRDAKKTGISPEVG
ncbi:hypothetical protein AB0O28_28975 [Microbispora sp. NPDC088329]|uniref:hypothetical protein n=1 Tax=Microbispora sp. NPDC088329 TaxID=3154869 RepID=UPI0034350998